MKPGFLAPILIYAMFINLVFANTGRCAAKRERCVQDCEAFNYPGCFDRCHAQFRRCFKSQIKRDKNWRRAVITFGLEAIQAAMRRFQVVIDS
ncbi:hypothetical protein ScPMuIL_002353 [Solemya velum]